MIMISKLLGSVRMTVIIVALVVLGIAASVSAVSVTLYLTMRQQALAASEMQQRANLAAAATILQQGLYGSSLNWTPDGTIDALRSFDIPTFRDTVVIDSITRVTGQDATVYKLDPATKNLVSQTTSLKSADGARLVEMALDPGSQAYLDVMANQRYLGAIDVAGVAYLAALQPIVTSNGDVLGALFAGTPMASVEAAANGALTTILMVGVGVTAALGIVGFFLSRLITRPIPQLAKSMEAIADGRYQSDVPYTDWTNEVGGMARAVEVFRQNGQRISQMTEAEADRIIIEQQDRQRMMTELQRAFGEVVDAAVSGDFTRHVDVEFPDPELNSLASGLNRLISTFDRGATEIGKVLRAMADTDLTQRMQDDYEGAFALIKSDINDVAQKLTEIVGLLRDTSGSLKTATGEILSGANDLSERTTRQAATIEETSAAMEQLASTVQENARRAEHASANAASVASAAEDGGQVMDAATQAMQRITRSSGQISNIIGMIDDIAFQTNLLALNASVEAARAGDAGKGFAVVAVEVRRLAQSAAQASADVKLLVEQSSGDITSGSALVGQAAQKLQSILGDVRQNSDLLGSIATQSREQAVAIEQVSQAVRVMDEMTQQNSALVEQTNAAIEQTEAQATELDRIVEIFHIETRPASEARSAARPRRSPSSTLVRGNVSVARDWSEF